MTIEANLKQDKAWKNLRVHFPVDFVGIMALKEVAQVIADPRFQMSKLNPELLESLIERLVVIEQHEIRGTYAINYDILSNEILRWLKAFPSAATRLIDEACRNWWLRVNRGAANEIGPFASRRLTELTTSKPMVAAYLAYYHGQYPQPFERAA